MVQLSIDELLNPVVPPVIGTPVHLSNTVWA